MSKFIRSEAAAAFGCYAMPALGFLACGFDIAACLIAGAGLLMAVIEYLDT